MTIKRVGIIGSGTMGSGIAEVASKAGFEVVLRSRSQSGISRWARAQAASGDSPRSSNDW